MGELLERTNLQLQQDQKRYHHHINDVNTLEIGSERHSLRTIDELEFLRKELKYTLLKFGITNEEANILLFLMKQGPTKASDIAKGTGISRTDVYYVLKSLQNKGLVIANVAKPVRFVSMPLEEIIDFLIHTQKQSLCSMENLKEQVKDIWSKIIAGLTSATQPSPVTRKKERDYSEVLLSLKRKCKLRREKLEEELESRRNETDAEYNRKVKEREVKHASELKEMVEEYNRRQEELYDRYERDIERIDSEIMELERKLRNQEILNE